VVLEVREERGRVPLDAHVVDRATRPGQLVDAAGGGDLALLEDDHALADRLHVAQQVGAQDEAHVAPRGHVADERQHLLAALGVEAVGGLVEQQQVRVVHQRLGQLDPLLHAGRVRVDRPVARLVQSDVVQHLVRTARGLVGRQARELRGEGHEAGRGHAGQVAVHFRHVADAPADLERLARGVEAERGHGSAIGLEEPEQSLEQRRLAGSVRPEQASGTGQEAAGDARERRHRPVGDGQAAELDQRCAHLPAQRAALPIGSPF
jgi:hypothetical protein